MILASAIIVTRALVSCHAVEAEASKSEPPISNRGSLGCKFWIWSSSFSPFQCPPKSVAASMCNNFHPHLIRDKDLHCATVLFKLFRSDVTGWQSLTQRCSHWSVSETVIENMALSGFVWQK